jgi:hypothetical protein
MYISNTRKMFTCGLRYKNNRWWTGFAYIIGLPGFSRSGANDHGPDYFDSTVRQLIQSFNCGVGFAF